MKYIIAQPNASMGFTVMQRQSIGEREVYVEFCQAATSSAAGAIADAMNAQDRIEQQ